MIFSLTSGLAVLFLFSGTNAHGRLTVPATRNPTGYENDPTSGYTGNDFVCRNALGTATTTVTAGSQLTLKWDFGALHVGDCAVYISYDYSNADLSQMEFFKIANLPDCKAQSGQDVVIEIPAWLPGGQAVLRWDWYALHVSPTVEFYAQCVDVNITPGASAVAESSLVKYSITNPPLYPANGNDGVGFWYPYGNEAMWMTGPPCANGYAGNNCALTAFGTQGYIDVNDNTPVVPVQSPTNPPVSTPVQTPTPDPTSPPVSTPVQTPTPYPTSPPVSTPVQSPTNPPVVGSGNGCQVYTVLTGDNLSGIAAQFTNAGKEVTWQEICDFNMLTDCDNLIAGDTLAIPCQGCGTVETANQVRKVYGVGVEVVVVKRCVDDVNMLGKDTPVSSRNGLGGSALSSESSALTTALLVGISMMTVVTLGLTIYVCRRQRVQMKGGEYRRQGSDMALPKMPTAPVFSAGSNPPPIPPRRPNKDVAWRI